MYTKIAAILDQLNSILLGKEQQTKLALVCLLADGHLLIEDLPGMGKTTLASALAKTLGLAHQRVQFTSDMLPADILGVSIFDNQLQNFSFHEGPVFTQILLADEINRASPKTQSALLEAMAERKVTIDKNTYPLDDSFFVIATQNPQDQAGTFPLPESQLDRFMMRIELGFPNKEAELSMLRGQGNKQTINAIINSQELLAMQAEVQKVEANDTLLDYLIRLVSESRYSSNFANALSPRCSKELLNAAKAMAFMARRHYVVPEDIQAVFAAVTDHRLNGVDGLQHNNQALSQTLLNSVDPLL